MDLVREADRLALAKNAPPGALVHQDCEILHFRGDTGAYLRAAPGKPSNNIFKMAREGLLVALRSALVKCAKDWAPVRQENVHVRTNGSTREITLEVLPVRR